MIINFSVQNFGPFKDKQTLSFEANGSHHLEDYYIIKVGKLRLLKMVLIYGANASGKTTILKALDFLRGLVLNPVGKKDEKLNFTPYLFDRNTPSQNTVFSIEFLQNEKRYLYEVAFTNEYVSKEMLYVFPQKVLVYKRTTDVSKQLAMVEFGHKHQLTEELVAPLVANTLWNNTLLGGALKTNIEQKEISNVLTWFRRYLSPIILPETKFHDYAASNIRNNLIDKASTLSILKTADLGISNIIIREKIEKAPKEFIEFIEQNINAVPEEVKEIAKTGILKKKAETKFEHSVDGRLYELPYDQESLGTKRYYGLACILHGLIINSEVISIDEIESSLHPDLVVHFLKLFLVNSHKSQLIATTHYRELLNDRDLFRDDAIWIADKSNTSLSTELYSLADFDTTVIRNTSNILNAYKTGKLGGIPNLGDYYIDYAEE